LKRLFHKHIDPYVVQWQPKNNRMHKRHYEGEVDMTGMPPPDCPRCALSEDALNIFNLSDPEFDADFSTGDEDLCKKKKAKKSGSAGAEKSSKGSKRKERDDDDRKEIDDDDRNKRDDDDRIILYKRRKKDDNTSPLPNIRDLAATWFN
ncbi:4683_t:CDS:1, partial [Ambispora leptoticha]